MIKLTAITISIVSQITLAQAALFANLEFGMTPDALQKALKSTKDLALKIDETYLARMGLNGAYTCVKPLAGRKFDLYFDYQGDQSLKAVKLYDQASFTADTFDTELKATYKAFITTFSKKLRAKAPTSDTWKSIDAIRENSEVPLDILKVSKDVSVYIGVANEKMRGYFVFCKFLQMALPAAGGEEVAEDPLRETKQAETEFQAGMEAIFSKDYPTAITQFETAAESGHARSMWYLANMYTKGTGVKKDLKKAKEYHKEAATLGYAMSLITYGKTFGAAVKALGITPEAAKSALEKEATAARGNCISALYNLGIMYKNGYGVPKDAAKASDLFDRAAKQGDKAAARETKESPKSKN